MKAVLIYFLADPMNPKKGYVGQTVCWKTRLGEHLKEARSGEKNRRCNWLRSLAAKGMTPEFEHVAQVPESDWKLQEIDYIAAFKTMGFELLNGTVGGDGVGSGENHPGFGKPSPRRGVPVSPETRAKQRAAKLGSKQSPETVAKRIVKLTGKKRTPEARARMSDARKALGLVGEKHHAFGKTFSAEVRRNMSIAKQGEKNPGFGKKQSAETVAKRVLGIRAAAIRRRAQKALNA